MSLPLGHKAIGLKWVFKLKRDEKGEVIKHKVRLVAKGYIQEQGVDFDDVFAPMARMESIRMLLAVATQEKWHVHHMDVKSAFLNGDLNEEVYVSQPPGFVVAEDEKKVLKLRKALYGLKQAPRAWNQKLDASLKELQFTRCTSEHGMYTRGLGESRVVVGVYVDDLIITGASPREIDAFKREMQRLFQMSDLGLLSFYLGIEVRQTEESITLSQGGYAKKLLRKAQLDDCNPCVVLMEVKLKLEKEEDAPNVDQTLYRSLMGSLRYLVHTHPDISFAVGFLSRFMEDLRQTHLDAVKHLLRYIAGTWNFGIRYSKQEGAGSLLGYGDLDFAGDKGDRRSTISIVFFLGNKPISWQSHKQKVVSLSTCQAEYIAGSASACQVVWLVRLMEDVIGVSPQPPLLKMDNMSAIALSKNPVLHDQSKHFEVRHHFICECVKTGRICLEHVSSQNHLADILTKPLERTRFSELRGRIGIEEMINSCKN
jgi:hypothetical protein